MGWQPAAASDITSVEQSAPTCSQQQCGELRVPGPATFVFGVCGDGRGSSTHQKNNMRRRRNNIPAVLMGH